MTLDDILTQSQVTVEEIVDVYDIEKVVENDHSSEIGREKMQDIVERNIVLNESPSKVKEVSELDFLKRKILMIQTQ